MGKGMKNKGKPKKGKKLNASQRAERRETGGWGHESTPFVDDADDAESDDDALSAKKWRRTAEQDDKARRKRARKQMHMENDNFVARMQAPAFEFLEPPSQKETKKRKKAEKRRLLTSAKPAPPRVLSIRQRASLDEEDEEEAVVASAVDSLRQKGLAYSKGKPPPLASGDSMVVEEDEQNDVDSDSDSDSDSNIEDITPGSVDMSPTCAVVDTPEIRAAYDRFFSGTAATGSATSATSSSTSQSLLSDSELGGATCISRDKTQANKFVAIRDHTSDVATRVYRDSGATPRGSTLEVLVAPGPSTSRPSDDSDLLGSSKASSILASALKQCAPGTLDALPSQDRLVQKFPTVSSDAAIAEAIADDDGDVLRSGPTEEAPPLQHTLNTAHDTGYTST